MRLEATFAVITLLLAEPAAAATFAIDGGTISVDGERIRVMGVDTPETVQAMCELERRAGEDAKRFTVMALARGPVRIERAGRDRYGRTLARVWIGNLDLARMLISAGHGREYHGERRRPWC
jgi:endonuclease YncB( thermonuclease family)